MSDPNRIRHPSDTIVGLALGENNFRPPALNSALLSATLLHNRHKPAPGVPNKKMAEQKAPLLALEEQGIFDAKEVDEAIEQIVEEPAAEE